MDKVVSEQRCIWSSVNKRTAINGAINAIMEAGVPLGEGRQ